jgi:hypothetical protein
MRTEGQILRIIAFYTTTIFTPHELYLWKNEVKWIHIFVSRIREIFQRL